MCSHGTGLNATGTGRYQFHRQYKNAHYGKHLLDYQHDYIHVYFITCIKAVGI